MRILTMEIPRKLGMTVEIVPSLYTGGEVSERPKELDWKSSIRVSVSRVRIPPSPPICQMQKINFH